MMRRKPVAALSSEKPNLLAVIRDIPEAIVAETHKIPLFPLGVVLLPDMQLPLHIFEERYKRMIADCLAEDIPFGIVLFDGQSIRAVGCLARITEVMERYDDGRLDIMTRGEERFVIQELIEDRAYMEARVFFFDDTEDVADDDLKDVIGTAWNLLQEMADIDAGVDPSALADRILPKRLAFALAALEGFTPISRNRLTREIEQMIGGNGHPPKNILKELENLPQK